MGRKQKKRTDASSVQGLFVTRNQALRKLQLTLAQFRYASERESEREITPARQLRGSHVRALPAANSAS